jgi:precorrin-3B C17-methyltransferase
VSGSLRVVGIGPGPSDQITPEVTAALGDASDIVGYRSYVDRVSTVLAQTVHRSDNGDELARARHALELASAGRRVVVVSGGDAGVFAMASAMFEAIERGPAAWRALDVRVLPGITAMLAAAARLGAPLGHDFCAINLSDNLKPWRVIEKRLRLAAEADFVISLYNPASRARPEQIEAAFEILRAYRDPNTIVMFARAIGRPDEAIEIGTLAAIDPKSADMRTLVIVGSSATRAIERPDGTRWVYTPRSIDHGEAR